MPNTARADMVTTRGADKKHPPALAGVGCVRINVFKLLPRQGVALIAQGFGLQRQPFGVVQERDFHEGLDNLEIEWVAGKFDERSRREADRRLTRAMDHYTTVHDVRDVNHPGVRLERVGARRPTPDDAGSLAVLAEGNDAASSLRLTADDHGIVTRARVERDLFDIKNVEHDSK